MHEYAQIENNAPIAWGLTIFDVRRALPNVLFLEDGHDYARLGFALVKPGNQPTIGRWQDVRKRAPIKIGDEWTQQFEVIDIAMPLADKRAEIKREADAIARAKRDDVTTAFSPAEMASWAIKRAEALAYQASGNAADAPSLAMEAAARGVSLGILVSKVLAKSTMLAALEATIAGRCGAIQDTATAATSEAELLAIDLTAGWPV